METVLVERELSPDVPFERLEEAERAVSWCLRQHKVTPLRSYVGLDGRRAVCIYEAPDAEALRVTQRQAGLEVVRVWTAACRTFGGALAAVEGKVTVVVERELDRLYGVEDLAALMMQAGGCLATHRAEVLASHVGTTEQRMLCVFSAPDAESVRIANRQAGLPVLRAWPAVLRAP